MQTRDSRDERGFRNRDDDDEFGLSTSAPSENRMAGPQEEEGHDDPYREPEERAEAGQRDELDEREPARREDWAPKTPPSQAPAGPARPSDGYTAQVYYDPQSRHFIATALEVPEIKTSGRRAELVLEELLDRLDTHLDALKDRGERAPEAYQLRKNYPEKLTVTVSQSLFRKLDILSRQEKVALEQLVTELISGGIERRFEMPRGQERRPQGQPNQNQSPGNQRHGGNRGRENRGRDNRGNRGRFNDAMGGSDNFMEYVRNLEKSGGPGRGNWRKR